MDLGNRYTSTIKAGQSLTGAIDLGPAHLFAIQMPAAFDGTSISFLADAVGENNFQPVFDENGIEKTITVAPARFVLLDPLPWLGIRRFKIRAGTIDAPSAQTEDRELVFVAVK